MKLMSRLESGSGAVAMRYEPDRAVPCRPVQGAADVLELGDEHGGVGQA
ncbi:hypothetical protein [Nonomuraea recticatena]